MSGIWSRKLKLSIFGESHGPSIGIVIDGLPSGILIDREYIMEQMKRRAPGQNNISTPRKEADEFIIQSGVFNGRTTGTPLCAIIMNSNTQSKDYKEMEYNVRPGHADYTGFLKYKGFADYRGGGHFSGRITAPLVFAGAVARYILEEKNIGIGSHIKSIGNIKDEPFDYVNIDKNKLYELSKKEFPLINKDKEELMRDLILSAKEEMDSRGGIIETCALNVPAGLGDPFFDSFESTLSHIIFSIPAVKGIEFGEGFDITYKKGSEANDEYSIIDDEIKTLTNNNGGILGGITNGMPIVFKTAIKPTPSIAKEQRSVNVKDKKESTISIKGRHDPCIVQRAIPVVEAALSIVILDYLL